MEAYCGVGTINDRFCEKCDKEDPGKSMTSILDSSIQLYNGTVLQLRQIVEGIVETKNSIIELKNSAVKVVKKSLGDHKPLEEFRHLNDTELNRNVSSLTNEIVRAAEWFGILHGKFSIFDIFPEKYC